ncbi:BnaC03g69870D [Brassica napus]|uniref:BnaC03g69870D protein n=1 Tax=Brassica napus TaxID=3708 RepID=A0A078GM51_BRANA|nr:BnaC03g69870D [Brassica napus]
MSTLYGIALGVARGVECLHHGCRKRIVHFDIKPHNVLLDDNLCPKVSDFGLAKLCEKRESILSFLDTRGTIGYIAPVVFSRLYGPVSYKSDVYSYGMLVLEMIGARNKETEENVASNSSSAYFPDWIYKDLENGEHTCVIGDGTKEENEIAKKIDLFFFLIIQGFSALRVIPLGPVRQRVVEMMEGSLGAIEVPPKPSMQISKTPLPDSSCLSEVNSNNSEELI